MKIRNREFFFECECGMFEHMEILCCHSLKVMDYLGVDRIPESHVMKSWMRDARDLLPAHLAVYQNDRRSSKAFTYRHSTIYMQAMELVRLGDASVEAYEKLCEIFKANMVVMTPFDSKRDGLGLEDRPTDGGPKQMECRDLVQFRTDSMSEAGVDDLAGLSAPLKMRGAGRPTTSRDRAPYEPPAAGLSKRTRFCTICKCSGHKRTTCP